MSNFDILLTNDDGVAAAGIVALRKALLSAGFSVLTVAPASEQSGCSHAITMERPLRLLPVDESANIWSVDGTPTDCLYLARAALLSDLPAMVVSGINHGANLAEDVTYSGTASAAMEGAVWGIPAISFSGLSRTLANVTLLADIAAKIVSMAHERISQWPDGVFLNVNMPDLPGISLDDIRITVPGRRRYGQDVQLVKDPRSREFYWIGGSPYDCEGMDGTDCFEARNGRISITPLSIDWHSSVGRQFLVDVLNLEMNLG